MDEDFTQMTHFVTQLNIYLRVQPKEVLMDILEFFQRQRLIASGELHPRILKPRKRKKDKNEVCEQEMQQMPPEIQEKLKDIDEVKQVLVYAGRDLINLSKTSQNSDLYGITYDIHKFIEQKCRFLDKKKRQIVDETIQIHMNKADSD